MKQPKIPVKMLTTLTILMVILCVGSYLLSPKWQAVRAEYQRQRDPLHQFASQQTPEAQLQALQDKIRANPQNSEQWALLGEYYLWQNDYSNSLLAYRQALRDVPQQESFPNVEWPTAPAVCAEKCKTLGV